MSRIVILFCCLSLLRHAAFAQQRIPVSFHPEYSGRPLLLDVPLPHPYGHDSLRITSFRCYISGITLLQNSAVVWTEPDSYHLIDAEAPESLEFSIQVPDGLRYNAVRFHPGIDSQTNAGGVKGGDLDPVKGMYWAWQSGYINMKFEGVSPRCATRRSEFQYHLGGFRGGDYALQVVTLPLTTQQINVGVDLTEFLRQVDLVAMPRLMIPGPAAVQLSKLAASMFKTEPQP